MQRVPLLYNGKTVTAVLLARFRMITDELEERKGWSGRTKRVRVRAERPYCLAFIPFKHKEKKLVFVSAAAVLSQADPTGEDVVRVAQYVSPFVAEYPYRADYTISDFFGHGFIYDHRSFVADVINGYCYEPLTLLYQEHPELLQEEFDEEA